MSSSEDPDQQSAPISTEENKSFDPMRKFRIFAGIFTMFVGFQTLYALVMAANLYLYNNLLVDILRFTSTLKAPSFGITIPIPAVIILLVLLIGGLVFCGKKGRARSAIWLAALITVPASFWIISLNAYIPGRRPPDPDYLSIIISLLVSIYLIWVLWKSSPKKMLTLKNLGIVSLIAGFVVVMVVVNGARVQLQKRNGLFYEINTTEPFSGKAVVS